jgi:periplasmic copper chaperone A
MTIRKTAILAGVLFWATSSLVAAELQIIDPWLREAPPNAPALGAFGRLVNAGVEPVVVKAAATDVAEIVELHATIYEGGMGRMVAQPELVVPPRGELLLEPGGLHIMLIKPRRPFKAGEEVSIVLHYSDGSQQPVRFKVRAGAGMHGGGAMMKHHGHHQ